MPTKSLMNMFRCAALFALVPSLALAQSPAGGDTPPDTAAAKKAKPVPPFDFSGVAFINYQYRTDRGAPTASNKFDLERVYLTFRAPAGNRTSVRITTDVYQQTSSGSDSYYRGWSLRAKYAYLQYNYLEGAEWKAQARIGLLQTVFIEQDEQYWPRWIASSPTDRAGYFSSSDAGISTLITMPRKLGELYAAVTNGPGYTSRETDRFKDFAARLTVTPWVTEPASPLRNVSMSAWAYRGQTASSFVNGGTGQVGSVGDGLDRNRWGIHLGNLDPRLTVGAEYASRHEQGERGSNTSSSPRLVTDSTGTLASVYAVVRPFPSPNSTPHPFSLIARYDRVTPNTSSDARYEVIIGGLAWDLSSRASLSLDYQENNPVAGSAIAPNRTWFAHFVAKF